MYFSSSFHVQSFPVVTAGKPFRGLCPERPDPLMYFQQVRPVKHGDHDFTSVDGDPAMHMACAMKLSCFPSRRSLRQVKSMHQPCQQLKNTIYCRFWKSHSSTTQTITRKTDRAAYDKLPEKQTPASAMKRVSRENHAFTAEFTVNRAFSSSSLPYPRTLRHPGSGRN